MKVWFITGTSRGFGKVWTQAALERGDKVVATARDLAPLDDLVATYGDSILTLKLDVTDKAAVTTARSGLHRLRCQSCEPKDPVTSFKSAV